MIFFFTNVSRFLAAITYIKIFIRFLKAEKTEKNNFLMSQYLVENLTPSNR